MKAFVAQSTLDRLAIGAAALCAAHCLLTPVLIVLVPVLASTLVADENFHKLMLIGVLPTSILALGVGCRRHGSRSVLTLGITGLAILICAALWGHDLLGEVGERLATLAGGLIMSVAHYRNYRLCRRTGCEH